MSYSRETGPPKYIVFYWEKSTLFDNISLRTMYRARSLRNEKGESQIDEYGMSADETDAFELFVKQAFDDAFNIVLKMTTGVTDAIIIDETITVPAAPALGVTINNAYGFKILDEEAYNLNNLYTVDSGVKDYVDAHVMAAWYSLVGHGDEHALWLAKLADVRRDLITKKLFQLRKPSIS